MPAPQRANPNRANPHTPTLARTAGARPRPARSGQRQPGAADQKNSEHDNLESLRRCAVNII